VGPEIARVSRKLLSIIHDDGIGEVWEITKPIIRRWIGERPARLFAKHREDFRNKRGLEIGGPSLIFADGAFLPVYRVASSIDNCNIAPQGVPAAKVPPGVQIICDGTQLAAFKDETYDFVLSSHTLEHMADPIKALYEWKRVLKEGGILLLCLPHKEGTFDHRRPTTDLGHLKEDFANRIGEGDSTHVKEFVELADMTKIPSEETRANFVEKSARNPESRYIHHHVFVTETVVRIVDFVGLRVVDIATRRSWDLIVLCRKTSESEEYIHRDNFSLLAQNARWRRRSRFKTDRMASSEP
jgi:SAM-dependent methyltransferase